MSEYKLINDKQLLTAAIKYINKYGIINTENSRDNAMNKQENFTGINPIDSEVKVALEELIQSVGDKDEDDISKDDVKNLFADNICIDEQECKGIFKTDEEVRKLSGDLNENLKKGHFNKININDLPEDFIKEMFCKELKKCANESGESFDNEINNVIKRIIKREKFVIFKKDISLCHDLGYPLEKSQKIIERTKIMM